jgi:hypothetical protein
VTNLIVTHYGVGISESTCAKELGDFSKGISATLENLA